MEGWWKELAELIDFYKDEDYQFAPGGKARAVYCSRQLYPIRKKLLGIGTLIDNLSDEADINGEKMRGVGEVISDLADHLSFVIEQLDRIDVSKPAGAHPPEHAARTAK